MNKVVVALALIVVALLSAVIHFRAENHRLEAEILRLGATVDRMLDDDVQLLERLQTVESQLAEARDPGAFTGALCDRIFPSGLYRLKTATDYGANSVGDYEIYHVSVPLSEWAVSVGTRVNSYGLPTDFYLDYDGDGRIDTPLAARFVREIPIAGNTLADRLLADSRVHQNLYAVFSCEWRNAEYTSSDELNAGVSETSNMLWTLVQQHSEDLVEWIEAL